MTHAPRLSEPEFAIVPLPNSKWVVKPSNEEVYTRPRPATAKVNVARKKERLSSTIKIAELLDTKKLVTGSSKDRLRSQRLSSKQRVRVPSSVQHADITVYRHREKSVT